MKSKLSYLVTKRCYSNENQKTNNYEKIHIVSHDRRRPIDAVTTSRLLAVDTASKEVTVTGNAVCAKCFLHEG